MVLGYLDDSDSVFNILQLLSHSSRAYAQNFIVKQKELSGFVIPGPISVLKDAQIHNELEKVTEYQHVDIKELIRILG